MFMDWKSQYCQDYCSPQINLKIKHGPYQNPSNFFGGVEIDNLVLNFIWKCKSQP